MRYNKVTDTILSSKEKLIIPVLFSGLVFLLLILFQPFEYRAYTFFRTIGDSLLSAFLVLLVTLSTRVVIPYLFREQLKDNRMFINDGIEIILDIVLFLILSFCVNLIYGGFVTVSYSTWLGLSLKYILIFEVLFIPLSIFIKHYFLLYLPFNQNEKDSFVIKQNIEIPSESFTKKIRFTSKTEQKYVEILPQDLIMIKSWSNYIEVFYVKDQKIIFSLLRNTLININDSIKHYPFLFRCHRSYVVNTNKILVIKGNTRGYQLTIEGVSSKVPVSRSRVSLFNKIYTNNE